MQTIKLNLIPGSVLPVVNVSQYDAHRQFALQVYEGASTYDLTGKSVEIRGTKPDGNGFAYDQTDGVVSVSGNTVTISTKEQMTAVGGHVMAELHITSGQTILGTLNFIIDVEPSALSDDTPISGTEIPAIERQLDEIVESLEVSAEDAEAWAVGERDGEPVPSSDPAYQNNAKYYAGDAENDALKAEGYGVGEQNGIPVTSGSPYYNFNANYFNGQANQNRLTSEGYAIGRQNGVPVTSESPYYHNNSLYFSLNAEDSATNAATSETNAGTSETNAGLSATAAANSASDAAADALKSEGFADGEQNGSPVGPGSPYYQNNAKYWRDQAAQYAAGGLHFVGSVAFANIPTTGMVNGDLYNITDDFTTDSRFVDGAGIPCKAGTDIAWVDSVSKWDLLNTGGGSTTLYDLADTDISSPTDGEVLKYNSTTQKWENGTGGGGTDVPLSVVNGKVCITYETT